MSKTGAAQQLQQLLQQQPSSDFRSWYTPDPALLFGEGRLGADPKLGLRLYGPCGNVNDQPIARVRVGIIGTGQTIQLAQDWLARCRETVEPLQKADPLLFPSFPGMTDPQGFNCSLEFPDRLAEKLAPGEVAKCTEAGNRDAAVEAMTQLIRERLDALKDQDCPPDVVLVALPEEVRKAAGGGRRPMRRSRTTPATPQLELELSFLDERRPEPESKSRTLHRAMKAEGMRVGLPTQLAWPTTFTGGEGRQDDATRAWNFCTALYYKAGGIPWRVAGLAKNTCYVGISFFRPLGTSGVLQTSMAQAFSDRGEGIVLRGSSFEWDARELGPPHLSREAAKELLLAMLEQYKHTHRITPTRVVVHKSSLFSAEEIAGIEDALAATGVVFFDFLSVSRSDIRFLRVGNEPPLRGTVIQIAGKRYVFYTRGHVPFLKLYPGLRIPRPMDVRHAGGSGAVTELAQEFLALTRMNWNSADFASAEPITLGFSRKIGLILSELPQDVPPQRSFRFYM